MATDGNLEAWTRLYLGASNRLGNVTNYFALQGEIPDGSVNPGQEALLDVDNLIDYMLVIFWGGNLDARYPRLGTTGTRTTSTRSGKRKGDQGFQFFVWDAEHTMLKVEEDRTGPFKTGDRLETSSPQWLWQQCVENPEFRLPRGRPGPAPLLLGRRLECPVSASGFNAGPARSNQRYSPSPPAGAT